MENSSDNIYSFLFFLLSEILAEVIKYTRTMSDKRSIGPTVSDGIVSYVEYGKFRAICQTWQYFYGGAL